MLQYEYDDYNSHRGGRNGAPHYRNDYQRRTEVGGFQQDNNPSSTHHQDQNEKPWRPQPGSVSLAKRTPSSSMSESDNNNAGSNNNHSQSSNNYSALWSKFIYVSQKRLFRDKGPENRIDDDKFG